MPLYAVCSTDEDNDSEEEDAEELEEAEDEEGSGPSLVTRVYHADCIYIYFDLILLSSAPYTKIFLSVRRLLYI